VNIGFESLAGSFGVRILGCNLAQDSSDAVLREIVSTFYREQLIVIPRQKLELPLFDEVTKAFGQQRPHFLDHLRMQGHSSILMLSNIYENGRQTGVYEGACFWHTDVAYEDPPNSATVVYAIKTTAETPTFLADMFRAYDALPEAMKRRIDTLVAVHHYGNREDTLEGSPTAAERLTDEQKCRVKNVYHPLVMRHPVTGRRSLYGVAGSSFGIRGMPDDEALDLLGELKAHATQSQFSTAHQYEPGELVAWDTYSTLHKAPAQTPASPHDPHARLLWRVSLSGVSRFVTPHQNGTGCAA
jgi:taurine dioxygenase